MASLTRSAFEALDLDDSLASFRDAFQLPDGIIYLNGNSLGPLPTAASQRVTAAVEQEWGGGLVKSWNTAGWFQAPRRLGDQLAQLIGADPGEVVVTDQTGLNVFKAVAAAVSLRPDRKVIVMEGSNFPTDVYMVQGLLHLLGPDYQIRFAEKDELSAAITADVAVVCLTQVHYKTAHILDMVGLTQQAHAIGALVVWDLCHSAGIIPVDLNGANADFAVGCTYKYLNGGPGSPGFIMVARRHQGQCTQPLTGWWGHAAPFVFDRDYQGDPGIGQMLTGTQPILSFAGMEAGLDLALAADMTAVRNKSQTMGDLFIRLLDERCGQYGFTLVSPRNGHERAGHVAVDHADGYPIMKALIAAGVIGDFRAPATMRFGFSPLFLRYTDVWDAVDCLAHILETRSWDDARFHERAAVT